jgi:hypothetical protein
MARAADSLADWFIGGAGKRRLLSALTGASPGDRFTQKELATVAALHEKSSVIRHLQVLERSGILLRDGPRGAYVVQEWPHRKALSRWLLALEVAEHIDPAWALPLPPSRGGYAN